MKRILPKLQNEKKQDGMIRVSWAKTQSKKEGFEYRHNALSFDLVDIKVCAIDETWSALKLVIRKGLLETNK